MQETLVRAVAEKGDDRSRPSSFPDGLAEALTEPLRQEYPEASAAAEGAFVLSAYCLAEGRVLSLLRDSPDLDRSRVAGDRTTSQYLSRLLAQHHIPHTEGALQSRTYSAGYEAERAKTPALGQFVQWVSNPDRELDGVRDVFQWLATQFASLELAFPDLPVLATERFTFDNTRRLVEELLSTPSSGRFEQYLVSAFLAAEYMTTHPAWTVETKRVGAADVGSHSPGDVQVKRRQALVHAFEVAGAPWGTKVRQASETARRTSTSQVTIVAHAANITAEQIASARAEHGVPAGVDFAVVDLVPFLDAVSARLNPAGRASAVRQIHSHLTTWERTRTDLVGRLVAAVERFGLAAADAAPAETGVMEVMSRLRSQVDVDDEPIVEVARGDLDELLGWAESLIEDERPSD